MHADPEHNICGADLSKSWLFLFTSINLRISKPNIGSLFGVQGQLHTPPGASCEAVGGPASLKALWAQN